MEQATCKVTEFHNTEFGAIRVIEDQGRLLFCGTDVAFALGYSKPRNAINSDGSHFPLQSQCTADL